MVYDVIIIGAGPAGLSAGIYAGRARLKTLIIEKAKEGGQIVQTAEIENYPGGIESESGSSLVKRMSAQLDKFGVSRVNDNVINVCFNSEVKVVRCKNELYKSKTVIIATGAYPVKIGCLGEERLIGKGISYCATCDAAIFEDFEVFVVGGGDSAVEEALYLTKFAQKVTIIHRRNELRAAKSIQEKAFANPKIFFMWDTTVKELVGEDLLESMIVENVISGEIQEIVANEEDEIFGVFVFIGYKPVTDIFIDKLDMIKGYISTDTDMRTNIPGVFAAGDVRDKSLRQVVTAASDGAIAAVQAEKYIDDFFKEG